MLMLPSTGQNRESFAQHVRHAVEMFNVQFCEQADYVPYFQKQLGKKDRSVCVCTFVMQLAAVLLLCCNHIPVCSLQ